MHIKKIMLLLLHLGTSLSANDWRSQCKPCSFRWEEICLVHPVEENRKFCYVFVPKNASESTRASIQCFKQEKYREDTHGKLHKIFVVRNPLYRPISIYKEVMKLRVNALETKQKPFYQHREDLIRSFKEFLDEIDGNFFEPHISYQHAFLSEKHLCLGDLDYVILFENYEE